MNDYIAYSVIAAVWVLCVAPFLFSNDGHMNYVGDVINGLKVTGVFSVIIAGIFLVIISVDYLW